MIVKYVNSYFVLFMLLFAVLATFSCSDNDNDSDDSESDDSDDDDITSDDDSVDDDDDDDDTTDHFQVGFARMDITPDHSVIMGGYGTYFISQNLCRWSTGSHDPIYATAVAFENPDDDPVILIHLDVVGAIITDIKFIQEGISESLSIPQERIVVASSHSHGSPDTIGIWGVMIPPVTGRDDLFIQGMIAGAIAAGLEAYDNRVPATIEVAAGIESDLHYNPQDVVVPNAITDDNMTLLAAYDMDDNLIGSLMNWGCHPMIMGPQNTLMSADYPGAYYRIMDEELGGVNMYINSSLGATVHPQNPEAPFELEGRSWGTWEDVDNFGRTLADDAQTLIGSAEPLMDYTIYLENKSVFAVLKNPVLALMGSLGLIPRDIPPLGEAGESTATAFSIGEIRFGTVPGELVPDLGLECRDIMGGNYQFLITLGMDWLGYIMTEQQYKSILYFYFSILSVGPDMGPAVIEVFHGFFDDWPEN